MRTELITRTFGTHEVRITVEGDNTWWVAKDVCEALDISNYRDALTPIDDDEKGVGVIDTLGGPQEMQRINEAGLYTLILRSNKPEAKAFRRWVTHEVLPTIRKTGSYTAPEDYVKALRALADSEERRLQLEEEAEKNNPLAKIYKELVMSDGLYTFGEAAKILYNHSPTGRNRLMALLRDNKYTNDVNEPYQRYIERDLFRMKEFIFKDKSGIERNAAKVFMTAKGIDHVRALVIDEAAPAITTGTIKLNDDVIIDIDELLKD